LLLLLLLLERLCTNLAKHKKGISEHCVIGRYYFLFHTHVIVKLLLFTLFYWFSGQP
jgi:hypothetical protein